MDTKLFYFVICALLNLCDSAYVDTIKKCSFKDDECVGSSIQKIIQDIGKTGIQELNIPPFDPMDIKGLNVSILGLLNMLIEEGTLTGIKDCVVNNIHNNFDFGVTRLDLVCDLKIKAKFKLDDISPLIQNLFGQEAVDGNGNIILKIDKIHMNIKFFYHIVKKDDGDLYVDLHQDDLISRFEIGNLKLTANKIFFGKQDLSEFIEKFFNDNWKSLLSTFGKSVFDVSMTVLKGILGNFFDKVPAKYYYTEDLTSYVKNL
ncbi:unnamed protein product [Euphydryas editha]|uniref:Uncharacterized protein n=1 Tax=Euphydryas editha TaxID=104508 RepID=A0AAU9THH3_EUPED|nr:unnamed protein product [Euphydryas editha]